MFISRKTPLSFGNGRPHINNIAIFRALSTFLPHPTHFSEVQRYLSLLKFLGVPWVDDVIVHRAVRHHVSRFTLKDFVYDSDRKTSGFWRPAPPDAHQPCLWL